MTRINSPTDRRPGFLNSVPTYEVNAFHQALPLEEHVIVDSSFSASPSIAVDAITRRFAPACAPATCQFDPVARTRVHLAPVGRSQSGLPVTNQRDAFRTSNAPPRLASRASPTSGSVADDSGRNVLDMPDKGQRRRVQWLCRQVECEVNPSNARTNHSLPNGLSLLKSNPVTNGETSSRWGAALAASRIQGGLYGTWMSMASDHRPTRRSDSVPHEVLITRISASLGLEKSQNQSTPNRMPCLCARRRRPSSSHGFPTSTARREHSGKDVPPGESRATRSLNQAIMPTVE
jgi:hypothetical protein